MYLAWGTPVVTEHQQEQWCEADEVHHRKRVGIKERPAVETRVQKRERCEPHQPLVHYRLETVAITEVDERGEQEHVCERDGVERTHLLGCIRAVLSHMTSKTVDRGTRH